MGISLPTQSSRNGVLRGVFLFIIMATLPCYCIGFVIWAFSPDPNAPTPTPTVVATSEFPTFTPIGGGGLPTSTTSSVLPVTPIVPIQPTSIPIFPPPIIPTNTQFIPATATTPPTVTPTNTLTATPTNTLIGGATPTFLPPGLGGPLLPPTDTPSP